MCSNRLGVIDVIRLVASVVAVGATMTALHFLLHSFIGAEAYYSIAYWVPMILMLVLLSLSMVPWYYIKWMFQGHTMDEETRNKYHRMM